MNQQRGYLAYLLRLWQDSSGDPPVWRASLESPQRDERRGFSSVDELITYLLERTGMPPPADDTLSPDQRPGTDSQTEED